MKTILLLIGISLFFLSCHKQKLVTIVHYNVINNGVGGNKSSDLLERISEVYQNKPDLVIIMIGTNDALSKSDSLSTYASNLEKIDSLFKLHHIKVLFLSPPPHGIVAIPSPIDDLNQKIDAETGLMDSISTNNGNYYFDMHTAFIAQGTPNATVSSLIRNPANNPSKPDGTHPTIQGYHFIAQQVYNVLKSNGLLTCTTISCFGDSITAAEYPNFLSVLLNGS